MIKRLGFVNRFCFYANCPRWKFLFLLRRRCQLVDSKELMKHRETVLSRRKMSPGIWLAERDEWIYLRIVSDATAFEKFFRLFRLPRFYFFKAKIEGTPSGSKLVGKLIPCRSQRLAVILFGFAFVVFELAALSGAMFADVAVSKGMAVIAFLVMPLLISVWIYESARVRRQAWLPLQKTLENLSSELHASGEMA